MASRIITLDGRQLGLKASGLTPILYRARYGRDAIADLATLSKAYQRVQRVRDQEDTAAVADAHFDSTTLNIYANFCHLLARQYDPEGVPEDRDAWLDSLETLSIYELITPVVELLLENQRTTASAKKNRPGGPGAERGHLSAPL